MNKIKTTPESKSNNFSLQFLKNLVLLPYKTEAMEQLKNLSENTGHLDCEWLIKQMQFHRLAPIIYKNLKNLNLLNSIPVKIKEYLTIEYNKTYFRNLELLDELKKVLDVFQKEGINVIPLKGCLWCKTIYDDIGSRGFEDIDLLVKKEDIFKVKNALNSLGYKTYHQDWYEKSKISTYTELDFYNENKVVLDIHWGINQLINFKLYNNFTNRIIWQNASKGKFLEQKVYLLSPQDEIIMHCLHMACVHHFAMFSFFLDMANLISYHTKNNLFDWHRLVNRATSCRVSKVLFYSLYYTKENLGIEIPNTVLRKLQMFKPTFREGKWFDKLCNINNCLSYHFDGEDKIEKKKMIGIIKFVFKGVFGRDVGREQEFFFQTHFNGFFKKYISHILLVERDIDRMRIILNYLFVNPEQVSILWFIQTSQVIFPLYKIHHFMCFFLYVNPRALKIWRENILN